MKNLKATCAVASLIWGAMVSPVAARDSAALSQEIRPELSARQLEIMQTVRSVDGYVDKQLHDEFWALMPSAIRNSPAINEQIKRLFSDVSEARETFQEQTWLSAKESLNAKRIIRTKSYLDARDAVLGASSNIGYQSKIRESIASADRFLAAAANGTPFEANGRRMFINIDLIERVLSGMHASEFRFDKLISPTWEDKPIEFRYPEAHVSVISFTPFTLDRKIIKVSENNEIKMVGISKALDSSTHVAINFAALRGRFSDPVKSLISNARAAIEGSGATGSPPAFIKWRGKDSATATGVAKTAEGNIFVAVRAVEVPEINGVIQFLVVSQLSGADAINQRGILEESSIILP